MASASSRWWSSASSSIGSPFDPDALGEAAKVRRRVQACPHAMHPRDVLDHRAHGALAVRARDVHRAKVALGVPLRLAGALHRDEPEAHAERRAGVEALERRQGGGRCAAAVGAP